MKRKITIQDLKEYCDWCKIFYRASASRSELEAAIARAALHMLSVSSDCFGFWSDADVQCSYCKSQQKCFAASMGVSEQTDIDSYKKAFDRKESITLVPMMKKKRHKEIKK